MDRWVRLSSFVNSLFPSLSAHGRIFFVSPKSTLGVPYQLFMDVYRAEKNVSHPTHGSSAEFKQGDALLSSSSFFFFIINKCPVAAV